MKKIICLFVVGLTVFLCSCGEEQSMNQVFKYQHNHQLTKAYELCKTLAEKNEPGAKATLATMIQSGYGCKADYRAGQELLEKCRKEKDICAEFFYFMQSGASRVDEEQDALMSLAEKVINSDSSDLEKIYAYSLLGMNASASKREQYRQEALKLLDKMPKYEAYNNLRGWHASLEDQIQFFKKQKDKRYSWNLIFLQRIKDGRPYDDKNWTQKDLEQAEEFIKYSEKLPKEIKFAHNLFLGRLYKGMMNYPKNLKLAEENLLKAFELNPNVFVMEQLAELYAELGQYELMDKYAVMALEAGYTKPIEKSMKILGEVSRRNDKLKTLLDNEIAKCMQSGENNIILKKFNVECVSNLKQAGLGVAMFAADHNDLTPKKLSELVDGNYIEAKYLACPIDGTPYEYAGELKVLSPSVVEKSMIYCPNVDKHGGYVITCFADGHVESTAVRK